MSEERILTEEEINLMIRLEEEAAEREEFIEKMLACSDYTLEEIVDWTDDAYTIGASFDDNVNEFERFIERKSRTGKEKATLVEKVVGHILAEKKKKRQTITDNAKIPKEWFNALIAQTCYEHNISEGHIRLVGAWNLADEVSDIDPVD